MFNMDFELAYSLFYALFGSIISYEIKFYKLTTKPNNRIFLMIFSLLLCTPVLINYLVYCVLKNLEINIDYNNLMIYSYIGGFCGYQMGYLLIKTESKLIQIINN